MTATYLPDGNNVVRGSGLDDDLARAANAGAFPNQGFPARLLGNRLMTPITRSKGRAAARLRTADLASTPSRRQSHEFCRQSPATKC